MSTTKMGPTKTIRVLLVEDHILVRQGTKAVIEGDAAIKVVGETDTADEAVRLVDQLGPDVVLLDIRLRGGTGIEVARALQRKHSPTKVLVVTAYDHEQYVSALARAGVSGYVLKDTPVAELVRAIHEVSKDGPSWGETSPQPSSGPSLVPRSRSQSQRPPI